MSEVSDLKLYKASAEFSTMFVCSGNDDLNERAKEALLNELNEHRAQHFVDDISYGRIGVKFAQANNVAPGFEGGACPWILTEQRITPKLEKQAINLVSKLWG